MDTTATQWRVFQNEKTCREENVEHKHSAALHICGKNFTVLKEDNLVSLSDTILWMILPSKSSFSNTNHT